MKAHDLNVNEINGCKFQCGYVTGTKERKIKWRSVTQTKVRLPSRFCAESLGLHKPQIFWFIEN